MAFSVNSQLSQGNDNLMTIMHRHQTSMNKSFERISSGLKINHAGDDSSGNAISEKMLTQIRALDQGADNAQSANSLLKVADAAITSIVDIVKTMRTRAIQAADDTISDDERAIISNELNQLMDQVDSTALATYNGRYLLTGDYGKVDETLQDVQTYDSDGHETKTQKLTMSSFEWDGDKNLQFQVGAERNQTITARLMNMTKEFIFEGVLNDKGVLDVSTSDAAAQTARDLDKSLTRALYQQTEIGVIQQRLDYATDNAQAISAENTAALSTLRDSDMAKEMTNYVKNNVLMQATQAMMAQANSNLATFIDLVKGS